MITRVNKSKTLSKYISGTCKCKFDSKKYNSNNDKCRRDCQILQNKYVKKAIFGTLVHALI